MLEGIKINPLKRHSDERGFFTEIMRMDWKDFLAEDEIAQLNFSISYSGIIRAWHRHSRGQIDYFVVLRGALMICAYDDTLEALDTIISTESDLQIVRIPGKYWHGFKALGNKETLLIYFVNKLYNYEAPDEERRPWNDGSIIPKIINGRKDDPRVGKPWDWNYPPHR